MTDDLYATSFSAPWLLEYLQEQSTVEECSRGASTGDASRANSVFENGQHSASAPVRRKSIPVLGSMKRSHDTMSAPPSQSSQMLAHSVVVRLHCEDQSREVVLDLAKQFSNNHVLDKFSAAFSQKRGASSFFFFSQISWHFA
jgi:hypothetical protein